MSILTLAEAKQFIGETGDDNDSLIQIYIDATEAHVAKYLDKPFGLSDVIETFSGDNLDFHDLDHYPVIFEEGSSYLKVDDEEIDAENYYLTAEEGLITLKEGRFNFGNHNCEAKYQTGWNAETIPADLKLAVLGLFGKKWNENKENGGKEVKSESFGDYSVVFDSEKDSAVSSVLDNYKRINV